MAKHVKPYIYWTAEEDGVLLQGGTPENRTETQCYTRARKLGIPRCRKPKPHWTPAETDLLRKGILPEGRSPTAAYGYCVLHGIPPVPTWRPYLNLIPEWSETELEAVRSGHVPPGRTARQCTYVATNVLHEDFVPADLPPLSTEDEIAIRAIRLANDGFPMSALAKAFKVSPHDLANMVANLRRVVLRRAKGKTKAKYNV